jgi:hypothetical protein
VTTGHGHYPSGLGPPAGPVAPEGRHGYQLKGSIELRIGEMAGLQVQDLEMLKGIASVERQVDALMAVKAPVADGLGGLGSWS